MNDLLILISGTIITLLPITNPFSTAPVFASMTSSFSKNDRDRQARLAAIYMATVLIITLLIGVAVLNFFAIGIPSLRIAGGLIIARIGFSMVSAKPQDSDLETESSGSTQKKDIAFSPIAMPLLSGPGSMAVVLSMATVSESIEDYTGVAIGVVIVAFITWLVLRSSTFIANYLGVIGMNALTSIMGFLLVCISIRFIFTGFVEGLTSIEVMEPIIESVQRIIGN